MSLHAQRVVVIGGTSGIGRAVAQRAAAQGAEIVIASSNQARIDAALQHLPKGTIGQRLDVTDEAAVGDFFDRLGDFDHLVYTAGEALLLKPITELTLQEARDFFEIRYWGAVAAVKYGAAHLRPGGSVVLSSGGVATRPGPGTTAPASVTGAVEALTRALALDLAPIRVNAVRPGIVRTDLWNTTVPEPDTVYDATAQSLPVQRIGSPDEVADAYLHLMNNGYSTGSVITIDGGAALT